MVKKTYFRNKLKNMEYMGDLENLYFIRLRPALLGFYATAAFVNIYKKPKSYTEFFNHFNAQAVILTKI